MIEIEKEIDKLNEKEERSNNLNKVFENLTEKYPQDTLEY